MFHLIIKKQGIITNGPSPFETEELALAHVAKEEANKSFGEPEHTVVTPAILDAEGNVISPESSVVIPAEYEVVIEDVTAQVEQEKINAEALAYLASTDYLILREMDNGTPCPAEIKAARQAARERIVR
jgi:hypothetical protein